MKPSKKMRKQCDFPGCASQEAWRCDVPTSWFRGEDVILNLCQEHRQKQHHGQALTTEKAKRQME